jgi:hypothetical protein
VLRRKIVGLRLALQAEQRGLLGVLVEMMRNRPHVVEKLGIDRPLFVFAPETVADEQAAALRHRLLQSETLPAGHDVAQAFVRRPVFIGGGRGGGEPALIDAAPVQAEGVKVIGMEFEAFAGLKEGARHPARRQPQQTAALGQGGFNQGRDFAFDNLERRDGVHMSARINPFSPPRVKPMEKPIAH